jgi:hypothetical protein
MKLYELEIQLGEKQELTPELSETYIALIKRDCSEALAAMKATGRFLYRGVPGATLRAFKGASRENRRPLSTKAHFQVLIDEMLSHYGFKALRSNSIYCTSAYEEAQYYEKGSGHLYMIFPINGFDYTWSRYSGDLYAMMGSSDYQTLNNRDFESFQEKFQFTNKYLNDALTAGHEVMVHGQYYAFSNLIYGYNFDKELLE